MRDMTVTDVMSLINILSDQRYSEAVQQLYQRQNQLVYAKERDLMVEIFDTRSNVRKVVCSNPDSTLCPL